MRVGNELRWDTVYDGDECATSRSDLSLSLWVKSPDGRCRASSPANWNLAVQRTGCLIGTRMCIQRRVRRTSLTGPCERRLAAVVLCGMECRTQKVELIPTIDSMVMHGDHQRPRKAWAAPCAGEPMKVTSKTVTYHDDLITVTSVAT